MERKSITVEEVVKNTIAELRRISVPAELIEEIGIPVSMAIRNLKACVAAWEQEAAAAAAEEPVVELFPTVEEEARNDG